MRHLTSFTYSRALFGLAEVTLEALENNFRLHSSMVLSPKYDVAKVIDLTHKLQSDVPITPSDVINASRITQAYGAIRSVHGRKIPADPAYVMPTLHNLAVLTPREFHALVVMPDDLLRQRSFDAVELFNKKKIFSSAILSRVICPEAAISEDPRASRSCA